MTLKITKFNIVFEIPNPNDKYSKLGIMARTFLMDNKEVEMKSQLMTKLAIEESETKEELFLKLGIEND
jgi:hypothetical protein